MAARKLWRKNETRSVRPFRSADDYLSDIGVRLYADQDFTINQNITIDNIDPERLGVSIRVPRLSPEIDDVVGVPTKDLRFVVSLEDPIFKIREVAHETSLEALFQETQVIDLPPDTVQQMSWAGETKVHAAVLLAEPRIAEVGTAERLGSWLARKSFSIGKPRETASFHIQAVDPEYFESRGLPRTTTYLVEIADEDLNQPCENLPDLVTVSIAKDVHDALGRDENSPMAKALERAVYVDVVTTVLSTGFSNISGAVEEDGILDVVTSRLEKSSGIAFQKLREMAGGSAGARLRAVVQADADLSRSFISATQKRAG